LRIVQARVALEVGLLALQFPLPRLRRLAHMAFSWVQIPVGCGHSASFGADLTGSSVREGEFHGEKGLLCPTWQLIQRPRVLQLVVRLDAFRSSSVRPMAPTSCMEAAYHLLLS
jgi:hypothetical protein